MMNNTTTAPRPAYCDVCEDTATVWVPNGAGWLSYCKTCDPFCDGCMNLDCDCTC